MNSPVAGIKAIIFDFDGLIIDSELPEFQSWCDVYEAFGQVLDLNDWSAGIGTRDGFDPYEFLEQLTGQPVDKGAVRAIRRPRYAELLRTATVLDGVPTWLHDARQLGLRVGLASSSDADWVVQHLDRYGLKHMFDAIRCAGAGLIAKPAPDLYLRVLSDFGVSAMEAIALEDSPNGVAAAKAAGLYCIGVPNQITAKLDLSHADLILPSLAASSLSEVLAGK
ncbi:MAG: HAD-IA family hydrolase [Dehalococcoidia bacterium]